MRDIAPDTVIDQRYSILSRLGSGGMADVYCAQDLQLGRRGALKLLYRRFAEDKDFVERFRREASSAAGLQHPNVVGVYDRGEWDGTYYIAMEYLEGRSLKQVVTEEGPLDPPRAIEVTIQVLRAARFAHQRGIIHRDLKPHNVILDDEGRAKVTDFGIARAGASDMTETGSIMGTAQYLSPEQAQGHSVSAASDLYAIGIVLYELLCGQVPFQGDSPVTIALKQVSEAPVPPSAYNPNVPPELDAVVLRALEKEPGARYATADEFIDALEGVEGALAGAGAGQSTAAWGAVIPTPPEATAATQVAGGDDGDVMAVMPEMPYEEEPEDERDRRRMLWLIGLLVFVLLAGGVLAYALTRPDKSPVPKVVGTQLAAAATVLENAGFQVDVQRVTSATAPKDRVTRQNPQPGAELAKGDTVTLTVSDGPGDATVPDVSNFKQADAQRALTRAGFKVGVRSERSDTVEAGRATRTSPAGGQRVEKGSDITLFVSGGPNKVTVPGVTGQTESSASAELRNAGLQVDATQEESDQDPGTVLSQNPGAGSEVDKNSTVTITVATAPTTVTVPDVAGQTQSTAASTISAAGLTAAFQDVPVDSPELDGLVQTQDPASGQKAKKGSSVTLTIGRFESPTNPTPSP
ncbi:MAG: Stk1 family PASTA domain-containing Ser/Thr kinase [Solirubrobacteraceae bacterium]